MSVKRPNLTLGEKFSLVFVATVVVARGFVKAVGKKIGIGTKD